MQELMLPIPTEVLSATVEAMRDLKAYYEADAAALAHLDSTQAKELAQERLVSAGAATGLYNFFGSL